MTTPAKWPLIAMTVMLFLLPRFAEAESPKWDLQTPGAAPALTVLPQQQQTTADLTPQHERSRLSALPRSVAGNTPAIALTQLGVMWLGSSVYSGAALLILLPLSTMSNAVFIARAILLSLGYPFFSAALVNSVGNLLEGGSFFGSTLIGALLGTFATAGAALAFHSLTTSRTAAFLSVGAALALTTTGPILGYHLGRRADQRRQNLEVGLAPIAGPPTPWGARSPGGAALQLRVIF